MLFGTDRVYQWSLYLLLSFWPLAVYWGMRLFRWSPWTSALGALVSPLLVSRPGLGYEDGSYTWSGYGTWAQLWGAWMLPLAWGLSWRAVAKRGSYALAALAVGLTMAVHLLTGYLAILSIGVWVLLRPPELLRRAARAAVAAAGALLVASFLLVPLLLDERVMPQSEVSRGTIYYDSFGAKQILAWLVTIGRWLYPSGQPPRPGASALLGTRGAGRASRSSSPRTSVPAPTSRRSCTRRSGWVRGGSTRACAAGTASCIASATCRRSRTC